MLNYRSFINSFLEYDQNQFLRKAKKITEKINKIERSYFNFTDQNLKKKSFDFKTRIKNGENPILILPEAFALVKHASRRIFNSCFSVLGKKFNWNMIYYDVQLIGGVALYEGKIIEMATGEGKTLIAVLPIYINFLQGKNCHVVTANDYLVKRDVEWMAPLYNFLGIKVGYLQKNMDLKNRKIAYQSDVTYGTASEFGFDYLKDHSIAFSKKEQVQFKKHKKRFDYCIIDEIDSILIDEARTPLILSGSMKENILTHNFAIKIKNCVKNLILKQKTFLDILENEINHLIKKNSLKNLFKKSNHNKIAKLLFKINMGCLNHKFFLIPYCKEIYDSYKIKINSLIRKEELLKIKQKFLFIINEERNWIDLTNIGKNEVLLKTNYKSFKESSIFKKKNRFLNKEEIEFRIITFAEQILRALLLYKKDISYVVSNNKIIIVDRNTGRLMPELRWNNGLHQALEIKENVKMNQETKTFSSITLQNYFKMYKKLSGMTGTAKTESREFDDLYNLKVISIPTNKICRRVIKNDVLCYNIKDKNQKVIKIIKNAYKIGQPVLVGTNSIQSSEKLSKILLKINIPHNVLNAKLYKKEADIISKAGLYKSITIATNMAGRGTDIKIESRVKKIGGLFIIGFEHHSSRRVDKQLIGRCARQGDPGVSKFFVSLEDNIIYNSSSKHFLKKFFRIDHIQKKYLKSNFNNFYINQLIKIIQIEIEKKNYLVRKSLFQYDCILDKHRQIVYNLRNKILRTEKIKTLLKKLLNKVIKNKIIEIKNKFFFYNSKFCFIMSNWITKNFKIYDYLKKEIEKIFKKQWFKKISYTTSIISNILIKNFETNLNYSKNSFLKKIKRIYIIKMIDIFWRNHILIMNDLKKNIEMMSSLQENTFLIYRKKSFFIFKKSWFYLLKNICIKIIDY
jgi:preprotein translocase subunit SecA